MPNFFMLFIFVSVWIAFAAPAPGLAQQQEKQQQGQHQQLLPNPPNNDYFWSSWKAKADSMEAEDNQSPVVINGTVRHPVIYFRQMANRRWHMGPLFSFLLFVSALFKLFLPGLTMAATERCRNNFYGSLSAAFIFVSALVTIVRFAFKTDDFAAMGFFTFGLLQLSYAIGCCLAVNLFAERIYRLLTKKGEPSHTGVKGLIYGGCILTVALFMTALTLIHNLGELPGVGNRILMLLATLGLGGLVHLAASSQKKIEI